MKKITPKPWPEWVCNDCGSYYWNPTSGVSTWHDGECGLCGKLVPVTEPRDFGYLPRLKGYEKRESNPLTDYL